MLFLHLLYKQKPVEPMQGRRCIWQKRQGLFPRIQTVMKLKSNIDSVEVIIFFNKSVFWLVNAINKMSDKECHFCCVKNCNTQKISFKDVLFIVESNLHMPELKYDKYNLIPDNKQTSV